MGFDDFVSELLRDALHLLKRGLLSSVNCRVLPVVHIVAAHEQGDFDTIKRLVRNCGPTAATLIPDDHRCWNRLPDELCLCRKTAEYFRASGGCNDRCHLEASPEVELIDPS